MTHIWSDEVNLAQTWRGASLTLTACVCTRREYAREAGSLPQAEPFSWWLRARCAALRSGEGNELQELRALSLPPCRKACSFKSMQSFGSHFRVDMDESGAHHVTYDSGVGELRAVGGGLAAEEGNYVVDLVRVGVLKDIVVLNYGPMNIVVMVVSWVAKDSTSRPRLRRDPHGFWLANMAGMPRDTSDPYMLPVAASQVSPNPYTNPKPCSNTFINSPHCFPKVAIEHRYRQVFFVNDKCMPGWSVVLAKEARGRRVCSHGTDHGLGQEQNSGDLEAYADMREMAGREDGGDNDGTDARPMRSGRSQTSQQQQLRRGGRRMEQSRPVCS